MQFRILKGHVRPVSIIAMAIALSTTVPVSAQTVEAQPVAETIKPASDTNGWGIATNDLTPDSAVRFGVLANGMKYAVKPNGVPKGGASVRFAFQVGFAAEADDEEGLAHFVEHMAFNGSAKIPEGELVKKLERLGLAFGADTNAMTTVHETVYKLDAPKADAETLDAVLTIMRETASELTISQAAVDRERGIILSEKQTRNTAERRHLISWLKSSLPETPVGNRLSSGSEAVLKNAPAERVKAFYRKYYRPDKATLIVVGDIDPVAIEEQIKQRFSDWQPVGAAGKMDMGKVNPDAPPSITNFSDPAALVQVKLSRMLPYSRTTNSFADQKSDYLESLGWLMFNKRLDALGGVPDTKVIGGGAQREDLFQAAKLVGTVMLAKGDDWQSALAASEQELRRAQEFGFTDGELTGMLAIIDNALRNAALQTQSRINPELAEALVKSAHEGTVFTTPEADLVIYEKLLPELTIDNVNAAFRQMWGSGPNAVHISTKSAIADVEKEAMAVLAESMKVAVTAPTDESVKAFAYDDFGKPGKVVSDKMIADLGIRTVRFANGAMLNIKKTAFETGKVHFALRAGSGVGAMPANQPGLAILLNTMSPFDGLQAHSLAELQKLTAGKTVQLGLIAEGDSFTKGGATTPSDLEFQLKLLAATITDFGFRPETQAQWPAIAAILDTRSSSDPVAVAQNILPNLLASGDYRIAIGDPTVLAQRNMGELKAAIDQDLKTGPIEIALVGDVDETAAIAMFARTFGALPKRAKSTANLAAPKIAFPTDKRARTLIHKGADDQGAIAISWPTTDDSDQKSQLTRGLLGNVMGLKLLEVVREKLGATYSPAPLMEASDVYSGFGYIGSWMVAEPGKMAEISQAVKTIAADLRDNPISDDLLLRARKPNVERFIKQDQDNNGWTYVASIAQSKPERLDRRRKRIAIMEAITPADIQKAAQAYLADAAMLEVRMLSDTVAKQEVTATP